MGGHDSKGISAGISNMAGKIRLLILDVDGVLTDGGIILSDRDEAKIFNVRDGSAIKWAQRNGIEVAVITGRKSEAVARRMGELKVRKVHQGRKKKVEALDELRRDFPGIAPDQIAYLGDDLLDIPVMRRVGFPCAVGDAVPEVKEEARFVTNAFGGKGAARELIEIILKSQDKWDSHVDSYRNM